MKQRGFTMIELILTIAVLAFGVVGVFSAFAPVVNVTSNTHQRLTAAYLAQEGLEIVRNMRDYNFMHGSAWLSQLGGCNNGCEADYKTGTALESSTDHLENYTGKFLGLDTNGFYSYDTDVGVIPTTFTRKLTLDKQSNDVLKVTSLVTWSYDSQSFAFSATGYLYDWY